jgi:2-isopropylmalate synthase
MLSEPNRKYRPFPPVHLPDRQWPSRTLNGPPIWCSVDLRDGNQALAVPMNVAQKLELFEELVRCGFKEIEVGFPAASNTEFEFMRRLIEDGCIPDDVTIQVLVQAREDLIERTVESLAGARRAIIHMYNSTSPAQRRVVFGLGKPEILRIATRGTQWVRDRLPRLAGTDVVFQYSPESFSATEVEYGLEICQAVMDVWGPTPERKMILNLPDTVEVAMPNLYADQVEWFCRNLRNRDAAIISVHTHNDRGTGTAATELAMLAGAERVEGTLFGNGERTGNLDIVQVALNLYMHGIAPGLDFSDLNATRTVYERCTGMIVPPRQPYAGELVFTAFSGSHQDAIKKGLAAWSAASERGEPAIWDVPYLTIDPHDIGRQYREVIRVNSQSGKGGVAYLLESEFGIDLPKEMQREFGPLANDEVDRLEREREHLGREGTRVTAEELRGLFWREYIERREPWELIHFHADGVDGVFHCRASVRREGEELRITGEGNGPIAAFVHALRENGAPAFEIADFKQHALSSGAAASAIAYICIRAADGKPVWGAAVDTNIELASIKAVLSALNRASTRSAAPPMPVAALR